MLPTKCLFIWQLCFWGEDFLTDQDKMSKFNRKPSIDDPYSYRVSVHLDKRLWRRTLKCEKLMDGGRQVMAKAHISIGKVS
jgi:hypothetical protein